MSTPNRLQIVGAALAVVALSAGLTELRSEFEPEDLVAADVDERPAESRGPWAVQASLEVLVLVQGADVLSDGGLEYADDLTLAARLVPGVTGATSLGRLPLPHVRPPGDSGLEALGDDLAAEVPSPEPHIALERLLTAAPERFPGGVQDVLDRVGGQLAWGSVFRGADPTEAELGAVRRVVAASATLDEAFLNEARTLAVVRVTLPAVLPLEAQVAAVRGLDRVLDTTPVPAGYRARLAGLPALKVSLGDDLQRDSVTLICLALLANLVILMLGFRSLRVALLPLGAAGLTLGCVLGAMGWLGVPLDLLTTIVPPLLITVVISDAVHFIARYREERGAASAREAAQATFERIGAACFVTSLTTAIGFGSLCLAQTVALRRFGITAALAVLAGYVVVIIALTWAMPYVSTSSVSSASRGRLSSWLQRIAAAAVGRPMLVLGLGAALFVGACWVGGGVGTDSAMLDQFSPDHPVRETASLLDRELGGLRRMEVWVHAGGDTMLDPRRTREVAQLAAWLRRQPDVRMVRTHADLLGEIWARLADEEPAGAWQSEARLRSVHGLMAHPDEPSDLRRWLSVDERWARVEIGLQDVASARYLELSDAIEERTHESDLRFEVAGEARRAATGLASLSAELLSSLAVAVFLVFLTLAILFRSLKLGLISLPPNLLPLAVVLAWMALRGIPLHASTVMVFAVSFGLVIDGTIHMIVRYREERARLGDAAQSAVATVGHTGRAVALGSLTVLVGFAVLFVSDFQPIRHFAELSCVAIITSLAAEIVVLPPLLAVFGAGRGDG